MRVLVALSVAAALAGCSPRGAPEQEGNAAAEQAEPETVDIPQTVTEIAPGTTPMAERVAVIGILNKRNGLSRDLEMRPGEAVRIGDLVVRLRACETTAPWEMQRLTGAFVQVDVRGTEGGYERVFSGWLYRETPSLNMVEHPVYDVWPKSCAMTHPDAAASPEAPAAASTSSSAPNTAPSTPPPAVPSPPAETTPDSEAPEPAPPVADDSN